tara:strand:- start:86 stop:394 length:309 start_codon:yes stop_codon:yes gene_type:complete
MKEIKTEKELTEMMMQDPPMPPSVMDTTGYGNLGFECGCGKFHGVNEPGIQQISSFRPVKILFKCDTHYTKVRIKGIFKQTCISEWTCKNTLLAKIVKSKGL